jgi:hypothetical protein
MTSQAIALLRRLCRNAWWATVSVKPDVTKRIVLIVGTGHAWILENGSIVPAGPAFGQIALKSGHSTRWSKSPNSGSEMLRA